MSNVTLAGFSQHFSIREKRLLLLVYLCVTVCIALGTYQITEERQADEFQKDAPTVMHSVGMRIGEIRTVLTSLAGLHYASDDYSGDSLSAFAAPLLAQSPYIDSIGRFDAVSPEDREAYESAMSSMGVYRFSIQTPKDLVQLSRRVASGLDRFFPVSQLEPLVPEGLALLGTDLGTVPEFAALINSSLASGQGFSLALPDTWTLTSRLFVSQPVYRGHHQPLDAEMRSSQSDGGYWIALSAAQLFTGVEQQLSELSSILRIDNGNGEMIVHTSGHISEEHEHLFHLNDKTENSRWRIGSSVITLTLRGQHFPYVRAVMIGAFLVSFFSALFALVVYIAHSRRVAEHHRLANEKVLYAEREQAERTLNSITDAIISINHTQQIVHMNTTAEAWLQHRLKKGGGTPVSQVMRFVMADDPDRPFDLIRMLRDLEPGQSRNEDLSPTGDESDRVLRASLSRTRDKHGDNAYLLVLRDVSVETQLTRELAYRANHDPLTGCSNRYYFEKRLQQLVDGITGSQGEHALVYMDLDQFKIVNDTCGHSAGDRLLVELTRNLKAMVRKGDVLSRLGGDEFGLLITDTNAETARQIANKIYSFFQSFVFQHENQAFPVRASIGFVAITQSSGTMGDIMSAADIACYTSKDNGRNSLSEYNDDDESMIRRHQDMNWAPELQAALQGNQFRLLVQSVAAISAKQPTGVVQHFEFLLRLVGDDGEEITPYQFIQAAERYDLMLAIDRWVIREAIGIVAALTPQELDLYSFSINLSGQSAADPTLVSYIEQQFTEYAVSPTRFWFEITETAAITHFSNAVELFKALQGLGAKVALDDFGSGLSSFGYLKNLPVDILKIDGQFVRDIAANEFDSEMVRAIDRVGKTMGIATVAEFVESQAIVDQLVSIGVDYAQGYHIGRPCPLDLALSALAQQQAS